jgi:hypothetical protein
MTDKIEEVDRWRLRALSLELQMAQMAYQAFSEELAKKYEIGKGESVDMATGTIIRHAST